MYIYIFVCTIVKCFLATKVAAPPRERNVRGYVVRVCRATGSPAVPRSSHDSVRRSAYAIRVPVFRGSRARELPSWWPLSWAVVEPRSRYIPVNYPRDIPVTAAQHGGDRRLDVENFLRPRSAEIQFAECRRPEHKVTIVYMFFVLTDIQLLLLLLAIDTIDKNNISARQ